MIQDLRYALRSLASRPLVTTVAVLSLALGIGVNTAIFSTFEQLLLRRLPVPVVVVPPDLRRGDLGDGPVVVATDMQHEAAVACRFAELLARRLERDLVVVNVVAFPVGYGEQYIPERYLEEARHERLTHADLELRRWIHDLHLDGTVDAKVRLGRIVPRVEEVAEEVRSCLVVCGSRRLDAFARTLVGSTGTELAATAARPVAIVPPDWVTRR